MKIRTSACAAISIFIIGCGLCNREHKFESADVDACDHFTNGPFERLEAGGERRTPEVIPMTHVVYQVHLPIPGEIDGASGFLSYDNKTVGDLHIYTQGVNASGGGVVEKPYATDTRATSARVKSLEVGAYPIHLDTEGEPDVLILLIQTKTNDMDSR